MAYTPFDGTHPDGAESIATVPVQIRQNQDAIADALVLDAVAGYDLSYTGDADAPTNIFYTDSPNRIWLDPTWTDGAVTVCAFYKSTNGGTLNELIGTQTLTYDSDGNLTGATWS